MATVEENHKIYIDQTDNLPMASIQRNKYVLIMYVYDENKILSAPLNSRSSSHMLEAYNTQVEHLNNRGHRPHLQWLDN